MKMNFFIEIVWVFTKFNWNDQQMGIERLFIVIDIFADITRQLETSPVTLKGKIEKIKRKKMKWWRETWN